MDFRAEQLLFSLLRFLKINDEIQTEKIELALRKIIHLATESFRQAVSQYSKETENDFLVSLLIPFFSGQFNLTPFLIREALLQSDIQAVPSLIDAVLHTDIDISLEAMLLLQRMVISDKNLQEKILLTLLQALQSPYAPVRAKAVTLLSQQKTEVTEHLSLSLLMDLLSEENILVKHWACHRFRQLSAEALSKMVQELPKKSEKVRLEVLEALRYSETSLSSDIVSFLLSQTKQKKNRKENHLVLAILGNIGRFFPEAITTLVQIASDHEYPKDTRQKAIEALGHSQKSDPTIVKFLYHFLEDTDFDYVATTALLHLGERGKDTLAVLIQHLQASEEDEDRQKEIQKRLILFGAPSVPEFLKYAKKEWFRPHFEKILLSIFQEKIETLGKNQGNKIVEEEIEKTIQVLLSEAARSKELTQSVRFILKELVSILTHALKNSKSEEKMMEILANQVLHQLAEAEKMAQEKGQKVSTLRKFELNEHVTLLREALNRHKS